MRVHAISTPFVGYVKKKKRNLFNLILSSLNAGTKMRILAVPLPLHFSTSTTNYQIAPCNKCFPILLSYYYGKGSRRRRLRTDPGGSLPGFRSLLHYQGVVNCWAGYSLCPSISFPRKQR